MRSRALGRTGIETSEIGCGTWSLAGDAYGSLGDAEAARVLTAAHAHGIRLFDTADLYAAGHVEELLGTELKGVRDEILYCSRVGNELSGGILRKNFKKPYLLAACEASLKRLSTDRIDLYLLHNPSIESMRRGECFEALEHLQQAGKVRAWGVSAGTTEEARFAIERGAPAVMLPYNALQTEILHPVVADAMAKGTALLARSTLAYGLLAGRWRPGHRFSGTDHRQRRWTESQLDRRIGRVDEMRFLVKPPIQTLAEAAIRFVLANRVVSVAVVGMRTVGQVEDAAAASTEPQYLPDRDLAQLATLQVRWRR